MEATGNLTFVDSSYNLKAMINFGTVREGGSESWLDKVQGEGLLHGGDPAQEQDHQQDRRVVPELHRVQRVEVLGHRAGAVVRAAVHAD